MSSTPTCVTLRRLTPSSLLASPLFATTDVIADDVLAATNNIINTCRSGGEKAVLETAVKFGDIKTSTSPYLLTRADLKSAFDSLPPAQQTLLQRTATRIRTFAEAQRAALNQVTIPVPGGFAGHTIAPVAVAGCYAPGGRFPLPSSVLMTAVTARAAGVEKVFVASPRPATITIAAAHMADADGLLCIGGAQAIATFAYGLLPGIPVVDTICGPGNKYVTAAKKIVSGRCSIDMLAGPSELLVFADSTADPSTIAADLLAQAEHDCDARPLLVTTDESLIAKVEHQLTIQLEALPTKETAGEALRRAGIAVVCPDVTSAISMINELAPEHLELLCNDADHVAKQCTNYGGLFIGTRAAEVLGDYGAGPNHTLPTAGTARYTGGLSVFNFLRIRTWLKIDDLNRASGLVQDSMDLAALEGLIGHQRSAAKRLVSEEKSEKSTTNGDWTIVDTSTSSSPAISSTQRDVTTLLRPDFRDLMEYSPVKPLEVLAEEIGMPVEKLCKLNANENLYGPIPETLSAISHAVHHIYPDPDQNAFRNALSTHTGLPREWIVGGCGSDELIDLLIRLVDPKAVLVCSPTFTMYKFLAQISKVRVIDVPLLSPPTFDINVPAVINAIRTQEARIVFITSPNNPTGTVVSNDVIAKLCAEQAIVVVDEAYAEFANTTALDILTHHPNLIILRTFSKWAGLAGLRVGYSLAHPIITTKMMQIKQPYNINVAADAAACFALANSACIMRAVRALQDERTRLMYRLKDFTWLHPIPSQSNFILVQVDHIEPRTLQKQLFTQGVLVRCYAGGGDPVLDKCIRISCGRPADTDRLLQVLYTIDREQISKITGHITHPTTLISLLPSSPSAILFDMDGVLAEVSQSYRQAIIRTAAYFDVKVTPEMITATKNAGNANNDWILTLRLVHGAGKMDVTLQQVTDKFQELYCGINGKGGLRDNESLLIDPVLLHTLSQICPLAVVTGRPREEAQYFLNLHNISSYFKTIVCMEDCPPKPDPRPVLLAMSRLGVTLTSSQYAIMIGDTPDDLRAAIAADPDTRTIIPIGIPAAGDASTSSAVDVLYGAGAIRVIRHLEQLRQIVLHEPDNIYQTPSRPTGDAGSQVHVPQGHGVISSIANAWTSTSQPTSQATQTPTPHTASIATSTSEHKSASTHLVAASQTTSTSTSTTHRTASLERVTSETKVSVWVDLDGTGVSEIHTGIGFLDHMFTALSKHSKIDMKLTCKGDLYIDDHHTTEDCALTLGSALATALGDKRGIQRFGYAMAPLDEALARAVVDISGRPHAEIDLALKREKVGDVSTEMLSHCIRSLATTALMTVHVDVLKGANDHHRAEAAFKSLAIALRQAVGKTASNDIPSTKGVL